MGQGRGLSSWAASSSQTETLSVFFLVTLEDVAEEEEEKEEEDEEEGMEERVEEGVEEGVGGRSDGLSNGEESIFSSRLPVVM